MDEYCTELINEKCYVRRPLESEELLQQCGYCCRACGTHEGQKKMHTLFSWGKVITLI